MSVLVEAISVIVRIDTIERKYNGGLRKYKRDSPNETYCADLYLTRVGFMNPYDVKTYTSRLIENGLVLVDKKRFVDIAVVDQFAGFTTQCDWLEFYRHSGGYSMCWLKNTESGKLFVPSGWKLHNSLSSKSKFVKTEDYSQQMRFVKTQNGIDVSLDKKTGKKLLSGRPYRKDFDMAPKPKWYLELDSDLRPPENKTKKLEQIRVHYQIPDEHFAILLSGSPATTRKLQYIILEDLQDKHPKINEKKLWRMVLASKSFALLNRGAKGISEDEINRVVSNASVFEDICYYILMLDKRECPPDPTGIEKAIIDAIEN